jgi:hypothetical protein
MAYVFTLALTFNQTSQNINTETTQTFHPSKSTYNTMMNLNLLLLSAAALFNGATAAETVELGGAADYAILAQTGISSVPDSSVTGHIAVSPIEATAITGFGLIMDSSGVFSTASQVTGKVYAKDYDSPTPVGLNTAVGNMQAAYDDAAGRDAEANTDDQTFNELLGGKIDGATLTPGVYTFTTDISISADITLDGEGIYIIRTTGALLQAASTNVILENGASADNIFWQVAKHVTVGTSAVLYGNLLVKTDAAFGHSSTLNGRVLAQTACNLDHATIVKP